MNATTEAIAIRNDFANDILKLKGILDKKLDSSKINLENLNTAVTALKNIKRIPKVDNETGANTNWGYTVNKIRFDLNEGVPQKTSPKEIYDLKLLFDLKVIGDCNAVETLNDPFKVLALDIVIQGDIIKDKDIKRIITCYHLDRHIVNEGDNSNEPHPIYHFQFGGKNLVNKETNELDTGDLIFLETPRIPHHPMELILGIDYILSHFFPKKRKQILKEDRDYNSLIQKYQKNILKPYYHTISNQWKFDNSTITADKFWSPVSICPQII